MILTYAAGAAGVAAGIYRLGSDSERALTAVTIAYVIMGLLSWVRHVLLWKQDVKRLNVTARAEPFFQWETGFANGGFAVACLVAAALGWGVAAMATAVLGYTLYLLQAAILHGYRYLSGQGRTPARLWGSFAANAALCILVSIIAVTALRDAAVKPW
jgi:hypothetical protein